MILSYLLSWIFSFYSSILTFYHCRINPIPIKLAFGKVRSIINIYNEVLLLLTNRDLIGHIQNDTRPIPAFIGVIKTGKNSMGNVGKYQFLIRIMLLANPIDPVLVSLHVFDIFLRLIILLLRVGNSKCSINCMHISNI